MGPGRTSFSYHLPHALAIPCPQSLCPSLTPVSTLSLSAYHLPLSLPQGHFRLGTLTQHSDRQLQGQIARDLVLARGVSLTLDQVLDVHVPPSLLSDHGVNRAQDTRQPQAQVLINLGPVFPYSSHVPELNTSRKTSIKLCQIVPRKHWYRKQDMLHPIVWEIPILTIQKRTASSPLKLHCPFRCHLRGSQSAFTSFPLPMANCKQCLKVTSSFLPSLPLSFLFCFSLLSITLLLTRSLISCLPLTLKQNKTLCFL